MGLCAVCHRLALHADTLTRPSFPFAMQFTNPLMALLVVAAGLTYMAYGLQSPRDRNNLILATALIIVVTLT